MTPCDSMFPKDIFRENLSLSSIVMTTIMNDLLKQTSRSNVLRFFAFRHEFQEDLTADGAEHKDEVKHARSNHGLESSEGQK